MDRQQDDWERPESHYERNRMPTTDVPITDSDYDVQVRIEDAANLCVGEMARAAMQVDAVQQLNAGLREALDGCEGGIDVKDMRQINEVVWSLNRAFDAAKALRALAPLPPEDDETRDAAQQLRATYEPGGSRSFEGQE